MGFTHDNKETWDAQKITKTEVIAALSNAISTLVKEYTDDNDPNFSVYISIRTSFDE